MSLASKYFHEPFELDTLNRKNLREFKSEWISDYSEHYMPLYLTYFVELTDEAQAYSDAQIARGKELLRKQLIEERRKDLTSIMGKGNSELQVATRLHEVKEPGSELADSLEVPKKFFKSVWLIDSINHELISYWTVSDIEDRNMPSEVHTLVDQKQLRSDWAYVDKNTCTEALIKFLESSNNPFFVELNATSEPYRRLMCKYLGAVGSTAPFEDTNYYGIDVKDEQLYDSIKCKFDLSVLEDKGMAKYRINARLGAEEDRLNELLGSIMYEHNKKLAKLNSSDDEAKAALQEELAIKLKELNEGINPEFKSMVKVDEHGINIDRQRFEEYVLFNRFNIVTYTSRKDIGDDARRLHQNIRQRDNLNKHLKQDFGIALRHVMYVSKALTFSQSYEELLELGKSNQHFRDLILFLYMTYKQEERARQRKPVLPYDTSECPDEETVRKIQKQAQYDAALELDKLAYERAHADPNATAATICAPVFLDV